MGMRSIQLALCFSATLLSACATKWERGEPNDDKSEAVGDALQTPMRDLNLLREDIPEVLHQARKQPYALPDPFECPVIVAEVRALDEVLGEDLDTRNAMSRHDNLAMGVLLGSIRGLMPYRSFVRKLTGAEKRDRVAVASFAAGTIRRGYLKGLGESQGCETPATPKRKAGDPELAVAD